MKCIALIPARYASTRFPAKLMQVLGSKTVIRHTYDNTIATALFDEVMVVTDSDLIYQEITSHGGKAKMSRKTHESGSDRIAEAVEDMDADIVLNVQGDEPFVQKKPLEKL
ncbi:MAG TPA: 3-deoxy-manno-octulosonate cytidylyltransferase, partial [Puia sp.]